MNVIIGEIIADFSICDKNDSDSILYEESFSGSIINFAEILLKEHGKDFEIVTKLGGDNLSHTMRAVIAELYQKDMEYSIQSPLLSAITIDGDVRLSGTAPATLKTEELELILPRLKPTAVLLSGALLSVNPSGSAIVDSLSFLDTKPKVFIDLTLNATHYLSIELLQRNVNELSDILDTYLIGDIVSNAKATKIEKGHLCDYLE